MGCRFTYMIVEITSSLPRLFINELHTTRWNTESILKWHGERKTLGKLEGARGYETAAIVSL